MCATSVHSKFILSLLLSEHNPPLENLCILLLDYWILISKLLAKKIHLARCVNLCYDIYWGTWLVIQTPAVLILPLLSECVFRMTFGSVISHVLCILLHNPQLATYCWNMIVFVYIMSELASVRHVGLSLTA